jgi:hypothetical protein
MQKEDRLFLAILVLCSLAGTAIIAALVSCVPGARLK